MTIVTVQEAQTQLTRLLREIERGEEVVISDQGAPVARLVRVQRPKRRKLGRDKGLYEVPEDFNDPLPEDVLKSFEE